MAAKTTGKAETKKDKASSSKTTKNKNSKR